MATIDDVLAEIQAMRADIMARFDALATKPATPSAPATVGGTVADDADLDGKYGDPEVRRDPPKWTGASYKGARYSACPADYLESLAGFLDWQAGKDEAKGTDDGRKYAGYARKDAARARGWASRNAGKVAGAPVDAGAFGPDDSLPF